MPDYGSSKVHPMEQLRQKKIIENYRLKIKKKSRNKSSISFCSIMQTIIIVYFIFIIFGEFISARKFEGDYFQLEENVQFFNKLKTN